VGYQTGTLIDSSQSPTVRHIGLQGKSSLSTSALPGKKETCAFKCFGMLSKEFPPVAHFWIDRVGGIYEAWSKRWWQLWGY
jgi:hypothetical protein